MQSCNEAVPCKTMATGLRVKDAITICLKTSSLPATLNGRKQTQQHRAAGRDVAMD